MNLRWSSATISGCEPTPVQVGFPDATATPPAQTGQNDIGGANPPDRDFAAGCGNGIGPSQHAPGAPYPGHSLAQVDAG